MFEFMQILAMELILRATWIDWMGRCDRQAEIEKARQSLDHAAMHHSELGVFTHQGEPIICTSMGQIFDPVSQSHFHRTNKA